MSKTPYVILAVMISLVILVNYYQFDLSISRVSASSVDESEIPNQPVHWHPRLIIEINGNNTRIPANVGIEIGKNIDNDLSGGPVSPVHTHDATGLLHVENQKPKLKPEALTLGYFFHVWEKNLTSECIFEYCENETHSFTVTVNNQTIENPRDIILKDELTIVANYDER